MGRLVVARLNEADLLAQQTAVAGFARETQESMSEAEQETARKADLEEQFFQAGSLQEAAAVRNGAGVGKSGDGVVPEGVLGWKTGHVFRNLGRGL